MTELQEIMNLIGSKYVFNKQNYPALKDMEHGDKQMFAINHSLLHMQKSLGKIAEVCEDYDHTGKRTNKGETVVEEAAVKMFINVLKLAEELGMSAEGLLLEVKKFYEDK